MKIRSQLYSLNILKVTRLSIPVISIGNLTMGGSGKTPTVEMIARFLQSKGFTVGIISRGYGGTAKRAVNVVSDGDNVLLPVEQAGDEPYMLAKSLPGVRVVTGKKRALPASYAQDHLGCDILILDDGFQHLAVYRNLDIVLFNATNLAGNNRVFPGGDLREPRSALQRADIFFLTGVTGENSKQASLFRQQLSEQFPTTPVFTTENTVEGVYELNEGQLERKSNNPEAPLYALSGIANPERFIQLLADQGVLLTGNTALQDHCSYNNGLLSELSTKARSSGAAGIITTHKDLVKIENLQIDLPLFCLKISAQAPEQFFDFLKARLSLD